VFDLRGRVALVTGAGQGVGAGIARRLAEQGAAVAVNDVRPERAEASAAALRDTGATAVAAAFDVTDFDAVVAGTGRVTDALGPVDVLVNNAGNGGEHGMTPMPFRETEPADWDGPVRVNLHGVLHCSRAVIAGMCERRFGRVVTIASGAGLVGLDIGVAAYGAGKGGAIGFMRHLAVENAAFGVTANTIALGLMEMELPSELTERLARGIPVGRLGTGADAGALCVYLASDEAAWMTGQTIQLNGGSVTD
jgi:NAD(P)-dependent dehydrogenase (short-subunit alcohol dehydrogenase family)